MSKNLWCKDICGNIGCIIYWRNAGILIIVFFMKNSALALLTYLLGAVFLLLQYAPKHVFPLGIDENVSCIPPPPHKADLGHLLAVVDKTSESQSKRESNCACDITKTGIFIKGSLQKWAKFQSDILAEWNDENLKLGDISRIADISSRINGHSLSLPLSLNRSQIIAISVSPAFIVLSIFSQIQAALFSI